MANITNSNKIIDLLNWIKQRLQQIEDSIPENVSELTNDAWYITNAVSDLVNYYDKWEVDDLLAWIVWLEIRKVDQLPDEWENWVIYLVPSTSAQDTYDEYIWVAVDSAFEKIWNFQADFSNYYDKDEVDNLLDQKADASDIPTVNDWTLDIQLNWASVETFSANSENNKTANIEVTKSTVWLWNVDNTSDADKPISTATQAALDLKADKTELNDYYTKTEVDAALDGKQDTLTAWTWITIENNVISADSAWDVMYDDFKFVEMTGDTFENLSWYKTINANTNLLSWTNLKEWMQYVLFVTNNDSIAHFVTVDWVNQAEIPAGEQKMLVYLATTSDSLQLQTCEYGISEDVMEYPDFNFVDKDWTTITLDLNSTITPTDNFTVNAPAEIKDWQIYILRVDGWATEFTMTLWTNITNPYNVDTSLWTNTLSQFVFLAVDDNLELQPQLMTRVDVENILREYNLIP